MPLRKRDLVFIAVGGGLLLVLALNAFRDRPKSIPDNDRHRPFRETLAKDEKRQTVEMGCVTCHSAATRPLPPKHPPTEQCLICHPF